MRLTLRTLLAYMDDMLEPSEHEELAQKIEASDFATELIHRSRDAVRRLRLGAPEVLADDSDDVLDGDPALDANTVAEYLDNVLPPEQVAEFERACLETGTVADMHLAEVTSCHHVLTMVLGEPADIEPKTRRRMYELPQRVATGPKLRIESAHAPAHQSPPPAPVASVPVPSRPERVPLAPAPAEAAPQQREEVLPDYLRVATAHQRRGRRMLTLGVVAILGGLTVWLFLGSLEPAQIPEEVAQSEADGQLDLDNLVDDQLVSVGSEVEETASAESAGGEGAEGDSPADAGEAPPFEPGTPAEETETVGGEAPAFEPSETAGDDEELTGRSAEEETAASPAGESPAESEFESDLHTVPDLDGPALELRGDDAEELGPRTSPENTTDDDLEAESEEPLDPMEEEPPLAPSDGAARGTADMGTSTADLELGTGTGLRSDLADDLTPDSMDDTAATDPAEVEAGAIEEAVPPVPPKPKEPAKLGTYLGKNDILLRQNSSTGDWVRLPEKAVINGGDTLLALPKYRTQILLGNANLYLSGGTRIRVPKQNLPQEEDLMAIDLELDYGRMILTPGANGTRVNLKIGGIVRTFDLSNLAYLAIDAHRVFVPGSDFENEQSPVEVHWYLTTGSLEWTDASGTTQSVEGPATWTTTSFDETAAESLNEIPGWIDDDNVSRLDYRARDRMLSALEVGQPVRLRLEELNSRSNPNRELRNLSSEASLHVGEFDPVVRALNDSDQKPYWEKHIEEMRQALARDPENVARLAEAFRQLRGEQEGDELMRMVRGFSPEEIGTTPAERQEGVALELIGWLEHPSLDYRVLAIYNLDQIKGTKNLKGYSPDELQRSRDKAVARIRQMLENNEF